MKNMFKIFIIIISIGVVGFFSARYYIKHHIDNLPPYEFFIDPRADLSIKVVDKEGKLIGVRGSYYGGRVDYETVSPHLVDAIIAIEDRSFFKHNGFDFFGIVRAFLRNLKSGSVVQGASTITQQLAKDLFLSSKRSYSRKLKELLYAIKLEDNYTKKQIMTLYLNRVYLGAGLYGVAAASERYFGKSAQELNVSESAMIAGLLKAPSRYNPTNSFIKAEKRASVVVNAMFEAGYITEKQKEEALKNPAKVISFGSHGGGGYVADFAADNVADLIGDFSEDLVVTVTIDKELQTISDAFSDYFVKEQGEEYRFSQAAFVAFDDRGRILAMTGGTSYQNSSFNRVVSALRQPGSAFKTFVYAAAFEAGFSPESGVHDGPVNYGGYKPANYTNKYKGDMSMRSAYVQSINTVAVKLAKQVGIGHVINVAKRCGINRKFPRYLSIALGSSEVSLLELTHGYTPFFNGGNYYNRNIIQSIKTASGKTLFELDENTNLGKQEFSENVVRKMKDIMEATIAYGTGTKAKIEGVSVYGKTGTTSNYRDAWFIGHAGKNNGITAGVWVGNDNTSSMKKATGGTVAAVLWHNILSNYITKYKPELFDSNISQMSIVGTDEVTLGDNTEQESAIEVPMVQEEGFEPLVTMSPIEESDNTIEGNNIQNGSEVIKEIPSNPIENQPTQLEQPQELKPQEIPIEPDKKINQEKSREYQEDKIENLLENLENETPKEKESSKGVAVPLDYESNLEEKQKNTGNSVKSVAEDKEDKEVMKPQEQNQDYSEDRIKNLLQGIEN